jgi:hypothetical protein
MRWRRTFILASCMDQHNDTQLMKTTTIDHNSLRQHT